MSINTEFIFYIIFKGSSNRYHLAHVRAVTVNQAYKEICESLTVRDLNDISTVLFMEISRMKVYIEP